MGKPTGNERVLGWLGMKHAPLQVRARVATAASFFRRHAIADSYLRGIDFSKDVREVTLNPGFHLVAYRAGPLPGAASWNPYGLFYSEVGASAYEVGIKPDKRLYVRYIVVKAAAALRTRAAVIAPGGPGAIGTGQGPRYLAGGRGWQYIVPGARQALRAI